MFISYTCGIAYRLPYQFDFSDDFFLRHMRDFSFPAPIKFVVASVNHPVVLVIEMPDIRAIPTVAFCTFYLIGDDANPAVPCFAFLKAIGNFRLYQIKYAQLNDDFMTTRWGHPNLQNLIC